MNTHHEILASNTKEMRFVQTARGLTALLSEPSSIAVAAPSAFAEIQGISGLLLLVVVLIIVVLLLTSGSAGG